MFFTRADPACWETKAAKNPKIQSIVKCVEVVELSPVSNFLKVAAVE